MKIKSYGYKNGRLEKLDEEIPCLIHCYYSLLATWWYYKSKLVTWYDDNF